MKYKVGDRVKMRSLQWCKENIFNNEDKYPPELFMGIEKFCGKILTISDAIDKSNYLDVGYYNMDEDTEWDYYWTDEMIEGLVEEEVNFEKMYMESEKRYNEEYSKGEYCHEQSFKWGFQEGYDYSRENDKYEISLKEGYIFKDQDGNVINATKIVLEKANTLKIQSDNMETETRGGYYTSEEETTNKSKKVTWFTFLDNDFADKVELDLSNRELIQEDGKWFVVKKYPKTYEECAKIMNCPIAGPSGWLFNFDANIKDPYYRKIDILMGKFTRLLICRDAYWKIAGEEMGLGKPWKPDWNDDSKIKYGIKVCRNSIQKYDSATWEVTVTFPTEEMRDTFKANFDKDLEFCKEIL